MKPTCSVTWADDDDDIWLTSVEKESNQESEHEGMPNLKDESEDEQGQEPGRAEKSGRKIPHFPVGVYFFEKRFSFFWR